jgi:hypothetical protein
LVIGAFQALGERRVIDYAPYDVTQGQKVYPGLVRRGLTHESGDRSVRPQAGKR